MTETSKSCTRCGAPLSDAAAAGLCPRCLMAMNFDSNTLPGDEDVPGMPPMSPEDLAARFPQYEILECLGRGGMGVVYKARQKSLNRTVAIKILAPEREHDTRFAERFAHEAELLAKLNHPNIVTIHDFGEADGLFYLVMEYVDGVNLRDLLREGKMHPEQALAIVPPVCEALEYAHGKGVVHRDIKPENLLLDRDGRVKIADFGIASLVAATGEHSGTPPYMAPEQERGSVDRRADIYALGVVLYEMLTGERPAKEIVAPSRKVQVDVRIDEIVLRALEKEPHLRYQTAEEFRTVVKTMAATAAMPEAPHAVPPHEAKEDAYVHRRGRKWVKVYEAFASAFCTLWLALVLAGFATRTYIDLGLYGLIGFPVLSAFYAAWRISPKAKPFGRAGQFYEWFSSFFGSLMLLVLLAAVVSLSWFKIGLSELGGFAVVSLCYAFWRDRRAGPRIRDDAKATAGSKWVLWLTIIGAIGVFLLVKFFPTRSKAMSFAPEIRRSLQAYPSGVNRFIDFDTGAVLSLPPAIAAQLGDNAAGWMLSGDDAPRDYVEWIERSGADALAVRRGLVIFNRACSAGHGSANTGWGGDWLHWNAINAGDVAKAGDIIEREFDRVAKLPKNPSQVGSSISYGVEGLSTAQRNGAASLVSIVTSDRIAGVEGHGQIWIFKTRRGTTGAFVLDENEAMPGSKRLRLKLVQGSSVLSSAPYDPEAEPTADLAFGPIVESEASGTLDFDTGELTPNGHVPDHVFTGLSPDLPVRNGCQWMEATGMDVIAFPDTMELRATAMKCVLLENEGWQTLSPGQLQRRLMQARMEDVQSLGRADSSPSVWGFQTREGALGVLQLGAQGAGGSKLRYKLLELPSPAASKGNASVPKRDTALEVLAEVKEKSITRQQLDEDAIGFFSFATGKVLQPPHRLDDLKNVYGSVEFKATPFLKRWITENHADLLIHLKEQGWQVLRFLPRESYCSEPQPMIENITATELVTKLGDQKPSGPWEAFGTAATSYYPTRGTPNVFQTRENLKGVYQIDPFDNPSGRGLLLRYRLLGPSAEDGRAVDLPAVEGK